MSETTTEAAPPEAPVVDAAPDEAIVKRARDMGWRPREEYTGDPAKWQEPADYVQRAETMLPLALANNRKLERKLEEVTGRLTEQQQLFQDMVQRTRKAEEIGYKRALREIEEDRRKAVAAGDTEAFNDAEQRMRDLGPPPAPTPPAPPKPPQQQIDPVVQTWIQQNPWFTSNPEAAQIAAATSAHIAQTMSHLSTAEQLAETTRRMQRRMPELFGEQEPTPNPRRAAPPAVSGHQTAATRGGIKPRSFEAMPKEVQQQYERQVRSVTKGEKFTKEEFATYYWEQFPDQEVA